MIFFSGIIFFMFDFLKSFFGFFSGIFKIGFGIFLGFFLILLFLGYLIALWQAGVLNQNHTPTTDELLRPFNLPTRVQNIPANQNIIPVSTPQAGGTSTQVELY